MATNLGKWPNIVFRSIIEVLVSILAVILFLSTSEALWSSLTASFIKMIVSLYLLAYYAQHSDGIYSQRIECLGPNSQHRAYLVYLLESN
jgi:hypothetical protein